MKTQIRLITAAMLLAMSALTQAAFEGDVSGGGIFNNTVDTGDGWAGNNGLGVDFWTITVGAGTELSIDVVGDFDYGISLYEGAVTSDFLGSFDNDGDYSYNFGDYATYVDGTPDLFGPFNSFATTLATGGVYTIAVGGVNGYFGSLDYEMQVSAVPVPAAVWLFGSALVGLFGLKRRMA